MVSLWSGARSEARVTHQKERKTAHFWDIVNKCNTRVFACGEDSRPLRLKSELFDLRVANANRIPLRGARSEARVTHQKERKTASLVGYRFLLEATPRFELGVEVLQTFALPLGHVAVFSCALIL